MTITAVAYRSEGQDDVTPASNGGYPVTIPAPSSGTWPTITSAADAVAKNYYRFIHYIYSVSSFATGGRPLLGRRMIFSPPQINKGKHYFTFVLADTGYETQDELVADIGNRRQYGTGWLAANLTSGVSTTVSVTFNNRAMIDGVAKILYANGTTLTDNINIDARAVGTSSDTGTNEEATVVSVGTPVDNPDGTSTVTLTLSAAVQNSYVAGGATPVKIQTFPDRDDYDISFDNKDLTSAGTADIDITAVSGLVVGNDKYTWEDLWTIDILDSAGTYEVTSQQFGKFPGQGAPGADFDLLCTSDTYFAEKSGTIKAGALSGTYANGQQITFQVHPQGTNLWMIMYKPASSGLVQSTVTFSLGAEEAAA